MSDLETPEGKPVTIAYLVSEFTRLIEVATREVPGHRWGEIHLSPVLWQAFKDTEEAAMLKQRITRREDDSRIRKSVCSAGPLKFRVKQSPKPRFT